MNFGELKASVATHAHRTDLTSVIPDFVVFAETIIAGDPYPSDPEALCGIRTRDQNDRYTAIINTEYVDTPTNMLSIRDAQINTDPKTPLTYLSPEEMTRKFPSATTGTPKFYTVHGDEFQFKPVPSGDFTLEMSFVSKYAALDSDGDTNWLLTNHPMTYVYASLIALSSYVADDPMRWAILYKAIAKGINGAADKGQHPSRLVSKISTPTP